MSVAVPSLDTSAAMALGRLAGARATGRLCAPMPGSTSPLSSPGARRKPGGQVMREDA
jgi:hypothetical protein